jgi:hypothetical protein
MSCEFYHVGDVIFRLCFYDSSGILVKYDNMVYGCKAVALTQTNFITSTYSGGSSNETGYSLKGVWEHQVCRNFLSVAYYRQIVPVNFSPNTSCSTFATHWVRPVCNPCSSRRNLSRRIRRFKKPLSTFSVRDELV